MVQQELTITTPFEALISGAKSLQRDGQWRASVDVVNYALGLGTKTERTAVEIPLHLIAGLDHRMLREYQMAETHFNEALIAAQNTNDSEAQVTALIGLMDLYRSAYDPTFTKDLENAETYRAQAFGLLDLLLHPSLTRVHALTEGALLVQARGDAGTAFTWASEASQECRRLFRNEPTNQRVWRRLSRALMIEGSLLYEMGNLAEAAQVETEAYDWARRSGDGRGMANAAIWNGDIYLKIGHQAQARQCYEKAAQAVMIAEVVVDQDIHKVARDRLTQLEL